MKTKVEAFEAVLSEKVPVQTVQLLQSCSKETVKPVLPEARVLLRRLTNQEIEDAGAESPVEEKPNRIGKALENANRGTFVLEVSEDEVSSPEKPKEKGHKVIFRIAFCCLHTHSEFYRQKSVAQLLARKSVDKAKHVALTAARTKMMQSSVQENPESVSRLCSPNNKHLK